jgi:flagellar capping protein FliD
MENLQPFLNSLTGIVGVSLGIFITEYFRRRGRVELYSKEIFQRRLDVYEKLYEKLRKFSSAAHDIMDNPEYAKEERDEMLSSIIVDLAQFVDSNGLYLNSLIVAQCLTILVDIRDVYYIEDLEEKKGEVEKFTESIQGVEGMIKAETGLEALDKLFDSISKANTKHTREIVSYFQKRNRELEK